MAKAAPVTLTITRLRSIKTRIAKLQEQVTALCNEHDVLHKQLETDLSEELDQQVTLCPDGVNPKTSKLIQVLKTRIKEKISAHMTFDVIASRLTIEGYKALDGSRLTGSIIQAIHDGAFDE